MLVTRVGPSLCGFHHSQTEPYTWNWAYSIQYVSWVSNLNGLFINNCIVLIILELGWTQRLALKMGIDPSWLTISFPPWTSLNKKYCLVFYFLHLKQTPNLSQHMTLDFEDLWSTIWWLSERRWWYEQDTKQ